MLRRDMVSYLISQWEFCAPKLQTELRFYYGAGKGTADDPGPFSYLGYAEYLLQSGSWGDQICAMLLSWMWSCKVTIIMLPTLTELRIRHDVDLEDVDLVLLLSGPHYSSVGR